jgi:hypothetical protein
MFYRRKRNKKNSKDELVTQSDFALDLTDSRFDKLLSGDARFGIDPLASEYKPTKGMQMILQEQQERRSKKQRIVEDNNSTVDQNPVVSNVNELAQKLKQKYKKQL